MEQSDLEALAAPLVWCNVTCHTEQCPEAGVTIRLQCGDAVICGTCWRPITDRVPVPENEIPDEEPDQITYPDFGA